MHRIEPGKCPSPLCPVCEKKVETHDHVYQCRHHISRANQLRTLETLREWGKRRNLHTVLIRVFLQHLNAWMRGTDIDTQHRTVHLDAIHTAIVEAVEEQYEI